ncbi:MAG TPA: hypothetical protein PKY96_17085 [Flavobacteriales bacterium]|nr:hypothetical protein [Flavobacteriales bacterium]
MILPNMTALEVLRHAQKDIPAVNRKFMRAMELLTRRQLKGDRTAILTEIHPYVSPARNNWFVVLRCSKAGMQVFHYCWFRGADGRMRAIYVRPEGVPSFYYTKHVFDRYSARFSPDVSAEERLRQFFLENHMWASHDADPEAEEDEEIISVNQGWLFGTRNEEDIDELIHLTTFVDQGHFFPDQHKQEERLEFERLLGGMSEGKRALLRRMREAGERGKMP